MTVKQLLKLCQEEIAAGYGDCSIMISNDDEGNGYHYLFYAFSHMEDLDDDVAPKNKTIILG